LLHDLLYKPFLMDFQMSEKEVTGTKRKDGTNFRGKLDEGAPLWESSPMKLDRKADDRGGNYKD